MLFPQPSAEEAPFLPVPRLLVELPSRPRAFFGNLLALVAWRRGPEVFDLRSAPAQFWSDVFVRRGLPWGRFFQSGVLHAVAGALLIQITHFLALQPQVAQTPTFDHSQVIYYQPAEYLPPIDTRSISAALPEKADPEFSPQPIISVPPESDNHRQTIVTPPHVKLKRDIAMPNVVAWSDTPQKPQLAMQIAPLTPAADIARLTPRLDSSAVAPPSAPVGQFQRRSFPMLQTTLAAPPAELKLANPSAYAAMQPALVAPPADVQSAPSRSLGDLNIAPSAVIAPAPQLSVPAQRSIPGGLGGSSAAQIAPPPSSIGGSAGAGPSSGSRGQVIALNLHPTLTAPPDPPAGNRRGTFAATPEGHAGAAGTPRGSGIGNGTGAGTQKAERGNLPAGLYVGKANPESSTVGASPAAKTPIASAPPIVASVRPPRTTVSRPLQPENASKLSEPERAVFGGRSFYSVTLTMPNLNSAGGSWVIRFAELNHESSIHDESAPAPDLSQPMATRKVDPAYPLELMRHNVSGTVILYAVIHADGSVGNVRVLRSADERLDRFASEAVAQWKFEPATKNGAPVDVEATFQIPFRPARVGTSF